MSEQSNPTAEEEVTVSVGEPEAELIPAAVEAVASADDGAPAAIEDVAPAAIEDMVPAAIEDVAPAAIEDMAPAAIEDMAPAALDGMAPAAIEDEDAKEGEESAGEDAGGDDGRYVDGPATYIERERGGRSRRIGSDVKVADIDYKNIPLLSRFLDRRGRILSRRKTRVSAKVQRSIVVAIKRARHLSLLPYTADQTRLVRKRR